MHDLSMSCVLLGALFFSFLLPSLSMLSSCCFLSSLSAVCHLSFQMIEEVASGVDEILMIQEEVLHVTILTVTVDRQ